MYDRNIVREKIQLYFVPHKLKWYQKLLQKLHIKNYYKRVEAAVDVMEWGVNNE